MSSLFHFYARQRLELSWKETDLGRKISIDFVRNRTDQLYGVTRVNAVYETRKYWEANDQEIITEFVSLTSFLALVIGNLCHDFVYTFIMM